ncbi:N-acetylglucosamine-1-phosphodiester alpha-N-acetylglucosaminidase isoform X2 [Manis pentadactyla]|uniref:N-acetylglucosamine-1-phosphodiester alpha-N-acetylglucosaminidase isoform X2 n=1 Tax=Manis pentadactyla TaxID=143292 RepID=UPI00255C9F76|nr:N-acetylglucosamine-1-phosphodiester alpha-N-acetylglucosaminidase isoform X2 [Manis pentadactyla]
MAASMGRWSLFLLAVLCFLRQASGGLSPGPSRDDDLLVPYPRASARSARDCTRVRAGSREHESWPPAPATPGARNPAVRTFVSYFADRAVSGHLTRAAEPLRAFSVLEPGGPGGCASRRRATVEETVGAAGCCVAQNGGFFRMDTGECLGNVVSDGRRVSSAGGLQNAQFGIRRDGTLVTGYLSEEEVLDTENAFVQLLSGVVWLIRNGSIYINESQAAECDETQETGSFTKFVNVMSARTAVGHDRKGQLVLFHADGQTEQRGQDSMWRCPRRVSTVVCIHEPRCQPPDCNGRGTCVEGHCQCTGSFWWGAACDRLDCGPSDCSQHGLCTETGCRCEAGWTGSSCSEACTNGSFGEDCARRCQCQNGAACDPAQGTCTCPPGFTGDTCAQECPFGWHGPGCQQPCECEHQYPCDPQTGNCSLSPPALSSILSQAKQCLQPSEATLEPGKLSLLTGTTWLALTLALVFLLLISSVANVSLLCSSRAERSRHLDGAYVYHQLQEMNGELLAAEKEQLRDACNPFKD